jgi:hypothetical protein
VFPYFTEDDNNLQYLVSSETNEEQRGTTALTPSSRKHTHKVRQWTQEMFNFGALTAKA